MSLLIGRHIAEKAGAVEALEGRVYPLVAPAGVDAYPFATYETMETAPDETKDGGAYDLCTVRVTVVAKEYGQAVEIAQEVRYALEGRAAHYAEFSVKSGRLQTSGEQYDEGLGAYVVQLEMQFLTVDN